MKDNAMQTPFVQPVPDERIDLATKGGSVTQFDSGLFRSMQAIEPRDFDRFVTKVLQEASRGGSAMYYQWEVKGSKSRGLVRGGSIGLATCMLRHYGKATAFPEMVEENGLEWKIRATFVDFENGTLFSRIFAQRKAQRAGDKMDDARAQDIALQIGQSKALRNVILGYMPAWLVEEAIEAAQKNEIAQIEKTGVVAARDKALKFLDGRGVTRDRIEAKFDPKKIAEFTAEDVMEIRGMCQAILDGQADPAGLFPEVETTAEEKTDKAKKVADDLFGPAKKPKPEPGSVDFPPECKTVEAMIDYLQTKLGEKRADDAYDKAVANAPVKWADMTDDDKRRVLREALKIATEK